ncbi:ATP-binding protein [Neobacillus sp. CF12]|uniref:ATP-binding protein n=1 Tax=Neobacillus sp. CF12 TaxID=3055864 RepID=UPI0025A30C92|nr:ATP-binding protein [Neobacillus sp. CF12]MDM5329981.1 ATP-binding protein [Neobacillus sp. CF12]
MNIQRIHSKNVLLIRILWGCFILCMLVQILKHKDPTFISILFGSGVLVCGTISIFVFKKIFIKQTMYLCVLGMSFVTFVLIDNEPVIANFYLIFLVIFILSLYHDYRPVILMSILSVFIGAHFYKYEERLNYTYHQGDFSYFLFTLSVTFLVAFLQIRYSRAVEKEDNAKKEEVRKDNEQQIVALINSMPDLIYIQDSTGRFIEMNQYAKDLFKLKDTEYRNKHLDELFSKNEWFRNFQNCFSNDEISWEKGIPFRFELELSIENQFSAIFDIIKVPTFYADGSRKNLLVIGRNITEQKKAQDLILRSEKLAVVGELAAGVAHEIRNPLTSIKGFMQLANQQGEFNPRYVQLMLSEISRIESIVSEYLSLAKPNQNSPKSLQNIDTLVRNVITLFESQTNLKNIMIHSKLDHSYQILCNPNEIKQVLINIFQNAIEAIGSNGDIFISVKNILEDGVEIIVIDNGCGIEKERLKKIGEPFFSTKEKGTGLGLLTSNRIIEKHNGTIKIHSEVNKGTEVRVFLPTN